MPCSKVFRANRNQTTSGCRERFCDGKFRRLSASRRRGTNGCAFPPGGSAEAPEPRTRSCRKGPRNNQIPKMLVSRQIKVRQIPVREGPDKLRVDPYRGQHYQKQCHHRQASKTHAVEKNRAPVIDSACGLRLRGTCACRRGSAQWRRNGSGPGRGNRPRRGKSIDRRHVTRLKPAPRFQQAPKGHVPRKAHLTQSALPAAGRVDRKRPRACSRRNAMYSTTAKLMRKIASRIQSGRRASSKTSNGR